MKKVFNSNSEVAHIFAQRIQNEGRANNMFFEDDTIYSYGRHFELAKFIDFNDKKYLFVNTYSFSNSTSKHLGHVIGAINKNIIDKVFYFDFKNKGYSYNTYYSFDLKKESLKEIIIDLISKAKGQFQKQLRARENSYLNTQGLAYIEQAQSLLNEFYMILEGEDITLSNSIYDLSELIEKSKNKAFQIEQTREERNKEKRAKEIERETEFLSKWINKEYNYPLYNLPVHVRINGEELQTSHGAKVPLKEALIMFKGILEGKNYEGKKIGMFTVNKQHEDCIKIGCHTIYYNNVSSLLNSLISTNNINL
jgi:hypothetical protein